MRVLAIDPGNVQSAYVIMDDETREIFDKAIVPNQELLEILQTQYVANRCVIEMVASYGMPVGADIFETVYWIGRFAERWNSNQTVKYPADRLFRKDVKMHICGNMRAKDGNIRQALIDQWPAEGQGAIPQIGTKKAPGPLYGFSKDKWAALAVAVTYMETRLAA